MKSGWKTTEFWVTILGVLGSIVAAVAGTLPPEYAAIGAAVASGFYAVSRGLAKKQVAEGGK